MVDGMPCVFKSPFLISQKAISPFNLQVHVGMTSRAFLLQHGFPAFFGMKNKKRLFFQPALMVEFTPLE